MPPSIGNSGGSEIRVVSKQGYMVILKTKSWQGEAKATSDVLIDFPFGNTLAAWFNGGLGRSSIIGVFLVTPSLHF